MAKPKTWNEKIAEVRRKDADRRRKARGPSATSDFFDVVGQLAGVTHEWTGADKHKGKR